MSDPSNPWGGLSLIDGLVAAVVGAMSFFAGKISSAKSEGREEGSAMADLRARMTSVSDRQIYLERRHDSVDERIRKIDEKIDDRMQRMSEGIAARPTRDEIVQMFARLERKIDGRRGED